MPYQMRPVFLTSSPFAASCAALLLMVSAPASGWAFLGLFEKDKDDDADSSPRAVQESAALVLVNEAAALEASKKYGKAHDVYRKVVHDYPATNAAAQSQFKAAEMSQLEGKERKAFDAYQLFIEEYKGSSLFSQAIERQFIIVQTARNNKKKKILGIGGGSSLASTEQVEMLDKIALNAPFSKYAPEARYLAAEIHRESKNYDFAILHYQQFVREYPDNSKAPTAQYEVARLLQ
jgi:TolA-binding protein